MTEKYVALRRRDGKRIFKVSRMSWDVIGEDGDFYLVKPRLLDNPAHPVANASRLHNSGAFLKSDYDRGSNWLTLYAAVEV